MYIQIVWQTIPLGESTMASKWRYLVREIMLNVDAYNLIAAHGSGLIPYLTTHLNTSSKT